MPGVTRPGLALPAIALTLPVEAQSSGKKGAPTQTGVCLTYNIHSRHMHGPRHRLTRRTQRRARVSLCTGRRRRHRHCDFASRSWRPSRTRLPTARPMPARTIRALITVMRALIVAKRVLAIAKLVILSRNKGYATRRTCAALPTWRAALSCALVAAPVMRAAQRSSHHGWRQGTLQASGSVCMRLCA